MIKVKQVSKSLGPSSRAYNQTPEVIDFGYFIFVDSEKLNTNSDKVELNTENSDVLSYVIMPQFNLNLKAMFYLRKWRFTEESIFSLGI